MNTRFHFSKTIYRPFNNIEEQNDWSLRTMELGYAPYIKSTSSHSIEVDQLLDPLGGVFVNNSGMVDVATLVSECKKYFGLHSFNNLTYSKNKLLFVPSTPLRSLFALLKS